MICVFWQWLLKIKIPCALNDRESRTCIKSISFVHSSKNGAVCHSQNETVNNTSFKPGGQDATQEPFCKRTFWQALQWNGELALVQPPRHSLWQHLSWLPTSQPLEPHFEWHTTIEETSSYIHALHYVFQAASKRDQLSGFFTLV